MAASPEEIGAEQRALHAALLEAHSDLGNGMALADATTRRFLHVNQALCNITGYTTDELLALTDFLLIVAPESREMVGERVRRRIAGREAIDHYEMLGQRKDGTKRSIEVSVKRVDLASGIMIVIIIRDITPRQQLQAQMLLNDRMASMGILASGVAHEINNPLSYVVGNLALLAEQLQSSKPPRVEELSEIVRDAREGAERVRAIVRDLKTFARVDEEQIGVVDVRRVMESSLSMVWNEIRHRARLVKDFENVPPLRGNDSRLGQVFLNLLINAAQAIPEGHVEQNEIRVVVRSDGAQVTVEVSDTGVGMPAEVRARIFEPFFTTKPIGVGTGLGLSICHRIVGELGGAISVESEVGRGTTVAVRLPITQVEEPAPPPAPTTTALRRGRILVVDDEIPITRMLRRALGGEHDVEAVNSGREALDRLLAGESFDVILCDLMMPEITGMELHAELHARAPAVAAKMIFLTGGTFTPNASSFLDTIENPRFEKPVDLASLRAYIRGRIV